MKLGPVGQMMKEHMIKGMMIYDQEREKEAQEAANLYPHGHWIKKLRLNPVEENKEEEAKEEQILENDAAL